jgi:hypothetical protein
MRAIVYRLKLGVDLTENGPYAWPSRIMRPSNAGRGSADCARASGGRLMSIILDAIERSSMAGRRKVSVHSMNSTCPFHRVPDDHRNENDEFFLLACSHPDNRAQTGFDQPGAKAWLRTG